MRNVRRGIRFDLTSLALLAVAVSGVMVGLLFGWGLIFPQTVVQAILLSIVLALLVRLSDQVGAGFRPKDKLGIGHPLRLLVLIFSFCYLMGFSLVLVEMSATGQMTVIDENRHLVGQLAWESIVALVLLGLATPWNWWCRIFGPWTMPNVTLTETVVIVIFFGACGAFGGFALPFIKTRFIRWSGLPEFLGEVAFWVLWGFVILAVFSPRFFSHVLFFLADWRRFRRLRIMQEYDWQALVEVAKTFRSDYWQARLFELLRVKRIRIKGNITPLVEGLAGAKSASEYGRLQEYALELES